MNIVRRDLVIPVYEHPSGLSARVTGGRASFTFSDIDGVSSMNLPVEALSVLCDMARGMHDDLPPPPEPEEPEEPEEPGDGEEPGDLDDPDEPGGGAGLVDIGEVAP